MTASRVDVGRIRREQIVDAAIAVIAEQGIQHLSLSEIEKKTGMARGQLTYYYKTKEDILLAVFDRLIQLMHQRATASNCPNSQLQTMPHGWERACTLLSMVVLQAPMMPAFYPLQYTFLSQIGHREDFRARLAKLYDEWRNHMAQDFAVELANNKTRAHLSPRLFASLVQATLHGLAIQRAPPTRTPLIEKKCSICSLTYWGTIFAHLRRFDRRQKKTTPRTSNPKSVKS